MFRTICEIGFIYLSIGMVWYVFNMACVIFGWAARHDVNMIEEVRKHWYVYCRPILIFQYAVLWPKALVTFVWDIIKIIRRVDNGELTTIIREVEEVDKNLF